MKYEIFDHRTAVGSAEVERVGLYWHITAEMRLQTEQFVRLYAHEGEKTAALGVCIPEDGVWRLKKRLAASSFSFTPDTRVDTAPEAENAAAVPDTEAPERAQPVWKPFSGKVLEYDVEGKIKRHEGGATLALRYEAGREFPLMPLFCFCRLGEAEGALCWLLRLDAEGKPVMPEEKKQLTSEENVIE